MTENNLAAETGGGQPVPAGWAARCLGGKTFRWLGPGLALFALVFCAYLPVLPGNFIMDDQRLVTSDNPLYNGEFTPRNIWFQTDFTVSTLGFWLQWLAWGQNPAGYHAVNMLLHGLSAVLLWRLLRRLQIPGAWLAGALFAVHPVAVNSVARIAELKNTLSLPFFLLSLRAWLQYESAVLYREPAAGRKPAHPLAGVLWYQLALLTFLLALLSKTSTVMLPPVLLLLAYWQRRRVTLKDAWHVTPFFILAGVMGLMSVWFQKNQALLEAGQTLAPTGWAVRLATAGKVFWFYLGKDLWPLHLCLTYPAWHTNPATLTAWLPVASLVPVPWLCWRFRRYGAGWLALGGFGLALFPVLGFFDSQFLVRWQVSDHLQYLPLIFPVSLVAAGLATGLKRKGLPVAAGIMIGGWLVLAHQRAGVFATEEALMRDTLARNPAAADAHNGLGTILARRKEYAEAIAHFTTAAGYQPADGFIQQNLGQAFAMQGRLNEAAEHYQMALKARPGDPVLREQYAQVLVQQGQSRPAMVQLQAAIIFQKQTPPVRLRTQLAGIYYQTGHFRRATAQLRLAVLAETNSVEAWNNLAWILATCPDPRVRDGAEAVRCATQADRFAHSQSSTCLSTLAAAKAEAGRFEEAAVTASRAMQMQEAAGQAQMAALNRQLLALYQSGQPYHDQSQSGPDPD